MLTDSEKNELVELYVIVDCLVGLDNLDGGHILANYKYRTLDLIDVVISDNDLCWLLNRLMDLRHKQHDVKVGLAC